MSIQQAALAVVERLRRHGHQALWTGGSVRDMLLGLEPTDIDVATDAPPARIVEMFSRTRKVGMQFGVVLVRQGGHWIETATFRTDVDYQDGRRPERVVFTTAEQDAQRRDFTINGLFYDPLEKRVIDYVGGQEDIRAGIVRAIGDPDERFEEDHLRMLRAVRFATRFNFRIEPATAEAIRRHAARITRISAERVREELERMLARPSRTAAVEQMAELDLLEHLWPEAAWPAERLESALKVMAALPVDVGSTHTGRSSASRFVLSMAALLHELPSDQVVRIGRALRSSNEQIADMRWLVENAPRLVRAPTMPLAEFKRLLAHPRFDDLLALHRAICTAIGRPLDSYEAARRRRAAIPPDEVTPAPLVTGEDLIAFGLQPGPRFKQILDTLYEAQLNNELPDRDKGLARMREMAADQETV